MERAAALYYGAPMRAARLSGAIVAGIAGVFATIGDLLMLWVANARRSDLSLPAPPTGALWLGALLGVVAIPLYAFGYRAAGDVLAAGRPRAARVFVAAGVAGVLVGALIHGLTARHLFMEIAAGVPGRPPDAPFLESGSLLGRLGFTSAALALLAWSVFAVGAAGRPETRWLAAANPVVITLAIALATAPSDLLRSFLGAAAPNLAHAIYFLAAGCTGCAPTTAGWRAGGGPART